MWDNVSDRHWTEMSSTVSVMLDCWQQLMLLSPKPCYSAVLWCSHWLELLVVTSRAPSTLSALPPMLFLPSRRYHDGSPFILCILLNLWVNCVSAGWARRGDVWTWAILGQGYFMLQQCNTIQISDMPHIIKWIRGVMLEGLLVPWKTRLAPRGLTPNFNNIMSRGAD